MTFQILGWIAWVIVLYFGFSFTIATIDRITGGAPPISETNIVAAILTDIVLISFLFVDLNKLLIIPIFILISLTQIIISRSTHKK